MPLYVKDPSDSSFIRVYSDEGPLAAVITSYSRSRYTARGGVRRVWTYCVYPVVSTDDWGNPWYGTRQHYRSMATARRVAGDIAALSVERRYANYG